MILDSLENKQKILVAFLEICPLEGFSDETLGKAFEKCEIDTKYQKLIFENGCFDLIFFYIDEKNRKLGQIIEKTANFKNFKIREKIRFALVNLFENEAKNKLVLTRLRNFYFDPKNFASIQYGPRPLFYAFRHVAKISDFIWTAIGDSSTDFNYYTKRLTLSKIILQVFAVFIKDDSANLQKTKEKIDAEIEKVMKFEKFKAKIKNISADLKEKSCNFFHDDNSQMKSAKQILRDLPFIRLFK